MLRPNRALPNRHRWRQAATVALLCSLTGSTALAHTQPKAIEQWGPFVADTVPCLRLMSRATHVCFEQVLDIEQRCRDAIVRGEMCDMVAVSDATDAATSEMRRTLATECTSGQLTEIGYIGFFDAEADLFNACVIQARAAVTTTYAPAQGGTVSPAVADCMASSFAYGRKVMRFALEHETPVIERFATKIYPEPTDKQDVVKRMQTELGTARTRWIDGVLAACPEFATVYGRAPENYLRTLQQRTECVLSKTYVNTAVSCLAQVCGNGIPEADEECDDGNHDDTDACGNNCRLNPQ